MTDDAIVFDKDGTLFDFDATWTVWAGDTIVSLAQGDAQVAAQLAGALDYNLETENSIRVVPWWQVRWKNKLWRCCRIYRGARSVT